VHLVTRFHFRSRDKDGVHTVQSAVVESPMLHADFIALSFKLIVRELLAIEVLHCGNRNFEPFLAPVPWPWSDDLHIRTKPIFPGDILDVWNKRPMSSKTSL